MKVAVSIPDDVFAEAEKVAVKAGLSRSGLYAQALAAYLASQREESITAQLNRVYASEDSSLDPVLRTMQARAIGREAW